MNPIHPGRVARSVQITSTEPVGAESGPGSAQDTKVHVLQSLCMEIVHLITLEYDEKNDVSYITIQTTYSLSD